MIEPNQCQWIIAIMDKIKWIGRITAVQPRIRLMRSFDERSHSYLGYILQVEGAAGDESGEFQIALGKAAQAKHQFRIGMEASGLAVPVSDPRLETAGFYKASGLKILKNAEAAPHTGPGPHGKYRGEKECPTLRRIGSTKTPPPTGGRMIERL